MLIRNFGFWTSYEKHSDNYRTAGSKETHLLSVYSGGKRRKALRGGLHACSADPFERTYQCDKIYKFRRTCTIYSEKTEESAAKTTFRFSIADTGIGMNKEFMKRMFEPFTQEDETNTSDYAGSGLGLAISKNLVEAMGGSIVAESYEDIEVHLRSIYLWVVKGDRLLQSNRWRQKKNSEIDLTGCHILLAEDHPLNVMVATKLLEHKGMLIDVAENGQKAVDLFSESKPIL